MRRFSEALLFVTCIFFFLSFTNGLQTGLLPGVKKNVPRKDGVIPGLLNKRQLFCTTGFLCDDEGCCPTNTVCCAASAGGGCCPNNSSCCLASDGTACCPNNSFCCPASAGGGCCPTNWVCCTDANVCCDPGTYCFLETNGVPRCCPNGEVCSGSAQSPVGNNQPTTFTTQFTPATTDTPVDTFTDTFTSSPTTTFTTLLGAPTQSTDDEIIQVSVSEISWSENWVAQISSCSSSTSAMLTTTENSSFTYYLESSTTSYSYFYYLNVVNYNTRWEVFVNNVSQNTYDSSSFEVTNCTFFESPELATYTASTNQSISVLVHGSDGFDLTTTAWSLEINPLIIQREVAAPSSTSALQAGSSTGLPLSATAGRTQPHLPLLAFGCIFLAVMFYS